MNHTSACINIKNSIEKHDVSILTVMLVFTHMNGSSIRKSSSSSSRRRRRSSSRSGSSKAMLLITVVVIGIIVLLPDGSTNEE